MTGEQRWLRYEAMADHLKPAAGVLAGQLAGAGGAVVDLGSGSGNGLGAARELGLSAIGVDLSVDQLRSCAHRIDCGIAQADVTTLPLGTASCRGAMSNFGVIFAGDLDATFAEAWRVLGPGSVLAFTAWQPEGWHQPARDLLADRLGQSAGIFPVILGDAAVATAHLERAGFSDITTERHTLRWHFADVDAAVDGLTTAAGGLRMLRQRLTDQGLWAEARPHLVEEFRPFCQPADTGIEIVDRYLLVTGSA